MHALLWCMEVFFYWTLQYSMQPSDYSELYLQTFLVIAILQNISFCLIQRMNLQYACISSVYVFLFTGQSNKISISKLENSHLRF